VYGDGVWSVWEKCSYEWSKDAPMVSENLRISIK
jgi:hypothetical protein